MFDSRAKAVILSVALLLSGAGFMVQPAAATSFNNVQIFANPISSKASNFQFAAYNPTGDLVASSQTSYSAAAFELPAGEYLFVATASDSGQSGYPCPLIQGVAGTGTITPAQPAQSTGKATAQILPWCRPPSSEYAYTVATITGPQTINMGLKNASTLPTTPVTVKVSYVNGTAAAGASVYASVVGEWYWWWYKGSSVNMSGQTDKNGIAHLVVPVAPTVITAWRWVPVYIKTNTTLQVNVGGQTINITAYWEPTYVGLSGSGLILPPQNSIDITLRYQQPKYWVMAAGIASRQAYANGTPAATVASQPTGMPSIVSNSNSQSSSQYLPSKIPALQAPLNPTASLDQGRFSNTGAIITLTIIFFAVGFGGALVAIRRRSNKPPDLRG